MNNRRKPYNRITATVRYWTVGLLILCMTSSRIFAQSNEADIKAMFLFNFIKYVEWPQAKETSTFRIGVIGKSPVTESLKKVIAQKVKEGRKIEVVALAANEDVECQLIFVPEDSEFNTDDLLRLRHVGGVLVISESAAHSEKWAAINLLTVENKIRFEINQGAAKAGGIKISSQLSNLAISVNP